MLILEKRILRRVLISNAYKYPVGGSRVDGVRLFSATPGSRTRVSGHKLKHRKVHLNTRKPLHWEGGRALEQTAQRTCGIFSGHIQDQAGCFPTVGNPIERVDWSNDFQRSLTAPTFLWFYGPWISGRKRGPIQNNLIAFSKSLLDIKHWWVVKAALRTTSPIATYDFTIPSKQ